jgi:hypothetical protein
MMGLVNRKSRIVNHPPALAYSSSVLSSRPMRT